MFDHMIGACGVIYNVCELKGEYFGMYWVADNYGSSCNYRQPATELIAPGSATAKTIRDATCVCIFKLYGE